jgi:hypothetical protein
MSTRTITFLSVTALLSSSVVAFNTVVINTKGMHLGRKTPAAFTKSLSYGNGGKTVMKMVAEQDEIAKLRAAAAKAREEARQLEKVR